MLKMTSGALVRMYVRRNVRTSPLLWCHIRVVMIQQCISFMTYFLIAYIFHDTFHDNWISLMKRFIIESLMTLFMTVIKYTFYNSMYCSWQHISSMTWLWHISSMTCPWHGYGWHKVLLRTFLKILEYFFEYLKRMLSIYTFLYLSELHSFTKIMKHCIFI